MTDIKPKRGHNEQGEADGIGFAGVDCRYVCRDRVYIRISDRRDLRRGSGMVGDMITKAVTVLAWLAVLVTGSQAVAADRIYGLSGLRKIAVIDTGVSRHDQASKASCVGEEVDLTGMGWDDVDGHGTVIQSLISAAIDTRKWCVVPIKWYHNKSEYEKAGFGVASTRIAVAINAAIDSGAEIINLSLSGSHTNELERQAIARALALRIHVVVAAGNEGWDLDQNCQSFPACYGFASRYFHVVGSSLGSASGYNHGSVVTDVEDHRYLYLGITNKGTSIATGRVSARLTAQLPSSNRAGAGK